MRETGEEEKTKRGDRESGNDRNNKVYCCHAGGAVMVAVTGPLPEWGLDGEVCVTLLADANTSL